MVSSRSPWWTFAPSATKHLGDRSGNFGVDVDVLALCLNAFDDAVGVNSFGVRIGCRIKCRRQRLGLLAGDESADERQHQTDAGDDENDFTAHPNSPVR